MNGKLLTLSKPAPPAPDEDVLRLCRVLLQWAEAGEVRSLLVVADTTDDKCTTGIAFANGANMSTLLGHVERGKARLLKRLEEEQEE